MYKMTESFDPSAANNYVCLDCMRKNKIDLCRFLSKQSRAFHTLPTPTTAIIANIQCKPLVLSTTYLHVLLRNELQFRRIHLEQHKSIHSSTS